MNIFLGSFHFPVTMEYFQLVLQNIFKCLLVIRLVSVGMGKTVDSKLTVEHAKESDEALPSHSTFPVLIPKYNTNNCRQDVAED